MIGKVSIMLTVYIINSGGVGGEKGGEKWAIIIMVIELHFPPPRP